MFTRRTLLCGVAALALFALAVTAGKPPPPPPPPADPAILYSWPAADRSGGLEAWVMNADASNQTPIITYKTHGLYIGWGFPLPWSGDNTKFAFMGRPDVGGYMDLYVSDIDGSTVTNILRTGPSQALELIIRMDWSPAPLPGQPAGDEWIILSANNAPGGLPDLYAIRSDGTGLVQLTNTADHYEDSPKVTPDGKFVLFTRHTDMAGDHRVYKATLGTDTSTGLPLITAEEDLNDVPGGPLASKNCAVESINPTGEYALVAQGAQLNYRWLVPLANPAAARLTSLRGTSWLDPETVVYAFVNSSNKSFLAKANVFTGQETIIASFGRTGPVGPSARRWHGSP